jgi:hypothetical protein
MLNFWEGNNLKIFYLTKLTQQLAFKAAVSKSLLQATELKCSMFS